MLHRGGGGEYFWEIPYQEGGGVEKQFLSKIQKYVGTFGLTVLYILGMVQRKCTRLTD